MEADQTNLPESILNDEGQYLQPGATASPQFSQLVSTSRDLLHEMEDVHTLFEQASQTSHSVFQEQRFCSYEIHQLKVENSAMPSYPTAAEMLRGAAGYVPNNRPVTYNPFHGLTNPFQGPMWSPPSREFPPAVYPNPQNFYGFSPSGTRVWNGLPPIHFEPRPSGDPYMMNMGFLPPSHQFRFGSGPCMLINMPEFRHGGFLPPRQSFFRPEGIPSWCLCLPMGPFYQNCRPVLGRDSMMLNGTPTSENKSQAEEEHHHVFTPDETKEQGRHVSSEPHLAFQDQLQTHWTWQDNRDVSSSICPKGQENVFEEKKVEHERSMQETPATRNSSFMDHLEDLSSDTDLVRNEDTEDLNTFDQFTLDDLQSIIENSMDPLFNEKDANETPPPPAEIERIIQYLLADAPITESEPNLCQNEQDFPDVELKNGSCSSSPHQQSLLEESTGPHRFFPLGNRFEEDMHHKNLEDDDDRKKHHERNSRKPFFQRTQNEETARVKDVLNDGKSKVCTVFRCRQGVQGHTDDSDGNHYALRAEEWKPADNFTPQRNPPRKTKPRKLESVRRQLFQTEQRPDRAKEQLEMAVGQEPQNCTNQRRESKAPTGKPLDFCRRMGMIWTSLSGIQEEPREEESGNISNTVRRRTQSKITEERVKPAQRKTRSTKAPSKKEVGENVYVDPGEPPLLQSLVKRGRTREKQHETTQPEVSEKTKAKASGSRLPPAQSKIGPKVDKYSNKTLKGKYEPKCPSTRTTKLPTKKTAEVSPEPALVLYQMLSDLHKQSGVFLGAKTSDRKPQASQRKGSRVHVEPEPTSTEQSEDEEAEEQGLTRTAKNQQRLNAPKKRKGGTNDTKERLRSSPVKKHRDSDQRGDKLILKKKRGTLRATWHHTE